MAFATGVLFVEGPVEAVVDGRPILGSPTGHQVRMDQALFALRFGQFAVAQWGDWVAIIDPGFLLFDETFARSATQRALWVSLDNVGSRFGFTYSVGGKTVRSVLYVENRLAEETGVPLPAETRIELPAWGYDESWVFQVVKRLTGVRWVDLEPLRYAVLQGE